MLDLILDTNINPVLLSSFVGALRLFGDNLGEIEEINIKGIDVEMIIVYKYNLILVAILDKDFMKHDIREEAEKALDMFYTLYSKEFNEEYIEVSQFHAFKEILSTQIEQYFNRIKTSLRESEIGDFGFFTDAIKKLRNGSH
ncbi:hypothetical protein LCGC14_1404600 [marine sediment metagenome]|uniref:Uncharacterized protein n=1 Tax=marine sediment metagenome TaxID=412755 RepID=A0A0F9MXM8_9ZZZZ